MVDEELWKIIRQEIRRSADESAKRISDINEEARKRGLTYGKYVAQLHMEKEAKKHDQKRAAKLQGEAARDPSARGDDREPVLADDITEGPTADRDAVKRESKQ